MALGTGCSAIATRATIDRGNRPPSPMGRRVVLCGQRASADSRGIVASIRRAGEPSRSGRSVLMGRDRARPVLRLAPLDFTGARHDRGPTRIRGVPAVAARGTHSAVGSHAIGDPLGSRTQTPAPPSTSTSDNPVSASFRLIGIAAVCPSCPSGTPTTSGSAARSCEGISGARWPRVSHASRSPSARVRPSC